MKKFFKHIWLHTPGKKFLFTLLRKFLNLPESIWKHLYFIGPFNVPVAENDFLLNHTGHRIENEIFWNGIFGSWEAQSLKIWYQLATTSENVIDIGANTGVYSLLAATANVRAKIFAVEPVPNIARELQANIDINTANIEVFETAISNQIGHASMFSSGASFEYSASLDSEFLPNSKNEFVVPVTTLDKLIELNNMQKVDLIKIDVEGLEMKVLDGMLNILKASRPNMIIEVLNSESEVRINSLAHSLGYDLFWINEETGISKDKPSSVHSRNMLLIRQEETSLLN